MPLLVGHMKKDEECCLICGDADYEEDNLIGFCDICGLSVHQDCYGIGKLDSETEFKCDNCRAFEKGKTTMLVQCVLCDHRGGAMIPTGILRQDFARYVELKNLVDTPGTLKKGDSTLNSELEEMLQRLEGDFETIISLE